MATCCLFLALKIEEKVAKMETVIKHVHYVYNVILKKRPHRKLDVDGQEYFEWREQLQLNERVVLQTVGFDFNIKHPALHVLNYVSRTLPTKNLLSYGSRPLARQAWIWCHASFGSEMCLLYEPERLACAFIYAAAQDLSIEIRDAPNGQKWWNMCTQGVLTVEEDELLLIILKLYRYCKARGEPCKAKGTSTDAVLLRPPSDPMSYGSDAYCVMARAAFQQT
jgi:hypothetical protein